MKDEESESKEIVTLPSPDAPIASDDEAQAAKAPAEKPAKKAPAKKKAPAEKPAKKKTAKKKAKKATTKAKKAPTEKKAKKKKIAGTKAQTQVPVPAFKYIAKFAKEDGARPADFVRDAVLKAVDKRAGTTFAKDVVAA